MSRRRRALYATNGSSTRKGEGASLSVFKDKGGADEWVHQYGTTYESTQKPETIGGAIKAHG